jgi:hypothetical protein
LLHFAGKRVYYPGVLSFGTIGLTRSRRLYRRPLKGYAALATEPVFSRIVGTASRARGTEASSTLTAKFHSGSVVGLATEAFHAGLPSLASGRCGRLAGVLTTLFWGIKARCALFSRGVRLWLTYPDFLNELSDRVTPSPLGEERRG